MHPKHHIISSEVTAWVDSMVVGLELCPFAPKVISSGELKLEVCEQSDMASVLEALHEQILSVLEAGADNTTLVVLPSGYDDFDDYLDLLAMAEELLVMQKLEGRVQLASFHPHYCFEGADNDDPANYSNRSPYPIIHLLQEASVSRALEHYPDSELISERNIARLDAMGLSAILQRLGLPSD